MRRNRSPSDVEIGTRKEIRHVRAIHARRETPHLQFGVHRQGLFDHHIQLRQPNRSNGRSRLAIEVHQVEVVELGDVESSDTQAGQREQVKPSDAPEPRNGDPPVAARARCSDLVTSRCYG